MFFYLIQNSTLIEKEINDKNRFIKILIYGSISYIILHATLFIGGSDSILYSLKIYFWLFLVLDCSTIYLTNKNIDLSNLKSIIKEYSNKNKNKNKNNNNNKNNNKKRVTFKPITENELFSDSDSDSDINTDLDIDLDSFKKSLDN
jgi:hypothetical protein